MSIAGRILTGLLGAAGIPLAWLVVQHDFATGWVAALLLALYEGVILLGAIVASVAQQVVRRRIEQVMDVLDLALGRRVSRYARYYRRYVLERDRHVNARDLAHTPSHIPELDAVYVDVGLAPGSPSGRAGGLLPAPHNEQLQRQSIHDFLDKEQPAVCAVIGAPGSGKSTLLRHTARFAASQGKERRRRIPVMLALRDHAESLTSGTDPVPTLAELIRTDVGALSVIEPAGWWEVQLRSGNCLILLDGLDEVARSEHRATITEWIEKQIAKHPKNDFVITSRPHGYQTAVIPQATVLQVRPFTTEQIRHFVHGWCRAAERLATGSSSPEIDQRAHEEAEHLMGQLSSAPSLMELAVNPLLLTMMVLVHRERRSLPAGRADLYHQVCDVMLWRRQESKKLEVKPPGAIRQRILAALAYDMMVAETRDYPKAEVLAVFDRALQQIDAEITADELLTAIVESSGLLVEREKDRYAFAHHTIGEYLASTHIRGNNLSATLVRSVDDPWWRETTLLYVTDTDATDIVEACLEQNTGASLALAFDCMRNHGQIDRGLRARLDRLREEAFEEGASPERRRLIASALAAGHFNRLITVESGTVICPIPVQEDLYWLFCKDTRTPLPDVFSWEPGSAPARAATGIWSRDAEAFVDWMNRAAVQENAVTFRLPTVTEVEFVANDGSASGRSGLPNTSVWTATAGIVTDPIPWMPDRSDPFEVTGTDIRGAVEADFLNTSILLEFVLAGALLDARALDLAFDHALTLGVTKTDETGVNADFRIAQNLVCNIDLVFHLARDPGCKFDIPHGLNLPFIYAQARSISFTDFRDRNLADSRILVYDLVAALSYSDGVTPLVELPHPEAYPPGQSYGDVRSTARAKVMGTALTQALAQVERQKSKFPAIGPNSVLMRTFTTTFLESAGVVETSHAPAVLDAIWHKLLTACGIVGAQDVRRIKGSWEASVVRRLIDAAEPVLTRAQRATPKDLADIRFLALLLAAEARKESDWAAAADFNSIAAGVTLLEKRAAGRAPLEALLLALE